MGLVLNCSKTRRFTFGDNDPVSLALNENYAKK